MGWGEGLVRFSTRPLGGQGQPYGDDVVAQARELVETTWLTQKQIGARIGVSHMTVCRWARAGGWMRPRGIGQPPDERSDSIRAMQRFETRTRPWRLLRRAEVLLATLPARDGRDLDRLEQALLWLREAGALHAEGPGPKRRTVKPTPNPPRSSS